MTLPISANHQQQVKRRPRSGSKIPIPTFAPPPKGEEFHNRSDDDNINDRKSTTENMQGNKKKDAVDVSPSPSTIIKLPLSEDVLVLLENALQLYWYQHYHEKQKQQQSSKEQKSLSYQDFMKCVSKLSTSTTTTRTTTRTTSVDSSLEYLLQLTKEERMWHDLYCVLSPTLYRVNELTGDLIFVVDNNQQRDIDKNDSTQNRCQTIRQLVQQCQQIGISQSKSKHAVDLISSLRRSKKDNNLQVKASTTLANTESVKQETTNDGGTSTVDSLLVDKSSTSTSNSTYNMASTTTTTTTTATSTIEERIRARAEQQQKNWDEAQEAKKDPREDRVAVADALYTRACHVLRSCHHSGGIVGSRFNSFGSRNDSRSNNNNNTAAKTRCAMTFHDIVKKVLTNRTRTDITKLLQDIIQVCSQQSSGKTPTFLRWHDPAKGINGIPISKNATVWIDTSDYKHIRAILNGENPDRASSQDSPQAPKDREKLSTPAAKSNKEQIDHTPVATNKTVVLKAPIVTVSSKKPTPTTQEDQSQQLVGAESIKNKKRTASLFDDSSPDLSPPPNKVVKSLKSLTAAAARTSQMAQEVSSGAKTLHYDKTSDNAGKKRPFFETSTSAHTDNIEKPFKNRRHDTYASPDEIQELADKTNHKPKLRINHDLIFCDADYDGGTIIQPSLELPRGLRRLFLKLNAGERI